jgi:hypothetical protein
VPSSESRSWPSSYSNPSKVLAALSLAQQGLVERTEVARCDLIKAFAKARVALCALDHVERPEVRPRRGLPGGRARTAAARGSTGRTGPASTSDNDHAGGSRHPRE